MTSRTLCLMMVLTLAIGIYAQSRSAATDAARQRAGTAQTGQAMSSSQGQAQTPTIARIVDMEIGIIEREFVSAAEAMPDDKFNFTPESLNLQGSDYKGVRSFAAEVKHVATANYAFFTPITGDSMPAGITNAEGPANLKSKAEIIKFLKDSFAQGHRAAGMLTPENATGAVKASVFPNPVSRLFLGTFAVQHANDHYGQMVEYLRMNGIVPPASTQQ